MFPKTTKTGGGKGPLEDYWLLTHDEMSRRSLWRKVSVCDQEKGWENILAIVFCNLTFLRCDNKLIMMIRTFWIWVWLNGDEVKSSLRAAEMLPAVFLPTVEFTMSQGWETRRWGPIRGEMSSCWPIRGPGCDGSNWLQSGPCPVTPATGVWAHVNMENIVNIWHSDWETQSQDYGAKQLILRWGLHLL